MKDYKNIFELLHDVLIVKAFLILVFSPLYILSCLILPRKLNYRLWHNREEMPDICYEDIYV